MVTAVLQPQPRSNVVSPGALAAIASTAAALSALFRLTFRRRSRCQPATAALRPSVVRPACAGSKALAVLKELRRQQLALSWFKQRPGAAAGASRGNDGVRPACSTRRQKAPCGQESGMWIATISLCVNLCIAADRCLDTASTQAAPRSLEIPVYRAWRPGTVRNQDLCALLPLAALSRPWLQGRQHRPVVRCPWVAMPWSTWGRVLSLAPELADFSKQSLK